VRAGDDTRIVVPADTDVRYMLAHGVHDARGAGHLGREKTYALLSTKFWWPKMYKWVGQYVRTCDVCQRVKPGPHAQAPLQSLPVPNDCWRSVSMDFFFGLPRNDAGHNGVLVFVDRLSKMVHLAPVSDSYSGQDCARVFLDVVFRQHGLPDSIVSDRDPRFTGDFWKGLFLLLGTSLDMSTADHPQTDGQTERANRVAEDILRSYCAESPTSWATMLPFVEFAMNNAVHASTGMTPFYVNGLRHPALPLSLMGAPGSGGGGARQILDSQLGAISKSDVRRSVDAFWSTRVNVLTRVRDAMAEAQDQQKEQADKHNRGNMNVFKIGDYVLLSTKNLSQDAVTTLGSTKLLPRFIGPFRVTKRKGTAYRLDLPSWLRTHPTFYVGLLKPYLRDEESESDSAEYPADAQASANANDGAETESGIGAARPENPPATGPAARPRQLAGAVRPRGTNGSIGRRSPRLNAHRAKAGPHQCAESAATTPREDLPTPAGQADRGTRPRDDPGGSPARQSAPARRQADPRASALDRRASSKSTSTRHARRSRPTRARLPVLDRRGEIHYHVEAIEQSRQRAGIHEGLVKWLGYPRSQSTWRAWNDLREDCPDLVRECERAHPRWFL
jgi:hypothetical protein